MTTARHRHFLDASGLACPLPVLRARKVLQVMPEGAMLCITVTDEKAPRDFEAFCHEAGHRLESVTPTMDGVEIVILRGPRPPEEKEIPL
ncbi:MAG: sulfurtransferase TusA family protein [Bdellovibrionales bacterium]|jgi:tRNA 2-thiouridine synthesizing protein A|nr:sulfurtransferase TusA family protein [Bdellovibrionales bacterium]